MYPLFSFMYVQQHKVQKGWLRWNTDWRLWWLIHRLSANHITGLMVLKQLCHSVNCENNSSTSIRKSYCCLDAWEQQMQTHFVKNERRSWHTDLNVFVAVWCCNKGKHDGCNGTVLWKSEAADLSTYSMCPVAFRWLQGFNDVKEKLFISV